MRQTRRIAPFVATLVVVALPGCYLAHERDCSGAPITHAAPTRPATPPGDDEVAFQTDAPPNLLSDDVVHSNSQPTLAFDGDGWGVSWGGEFRLLDRDGARVGSASTGGGSTGMAFGAGRFALAAPDPSRSRLLFVDASAAHVTPQGNYGGAQTSAVAWLPNRRAWVVASAAPRRPLTAPARIDIQVIGADGASLETLSLTDPLSADVTVRIAATDRHALVLWVGGTHVLQGVLLGDNPLRVLGEPFDVIIDEVRGAGAPAVVAYGDRFLVGSLDGMQVRVATIEPTDCGATGGRPVVVGAAPISDQPPGIASAPDRGFYVVCFVVGDGLTLQAVGEDAHPWGRPFPLVTGISSIGGLDCGWNGDEVVVVWNEQGSGSVFSQLVRPTFL